MEDLERYSDYNEYEEDEPKKKSVVGRILKILVGVVCVGVIGVLVFRMILFSYYPDSMKNVYFNDTLTAYYNSTDGKVNAKTQDLRAPYDDPEKGNFFCDNLIVFTDINQLQLSVRYNVSLMENIKNDENLAVTLDPDSTDNFTFRLVRNPASEDGEPVVIGELDYVDFDSLLMYRYYKLVFDNVDFGLDKGENKVEWIRLEIFINGVDMKSPYMIPVYENNDVYSKLDEYKLSSKECPQ